MNANEPLAAFVELLARRTAELVLERLGQTASTATAGAPPLLTKQALAAALSISVAGVDRLARDGRIPCVRVGDLRRFDLAAVRAALAPDEVAPAQAKVPRSPAAAMRLLSRGPR